MKTIFGTSRIAIIFSNFVIKLPRIYFAEGFHQLWRASSISLKCIFSSERKRYRAVKKGRKETRKEMLQYAKIYHLPGTCQRSWFYGIMSNYHEYIFSIKNRKNSFIVPTYFSLFGLLNIQKKGEEFEMDNKEFEDQIKSTLEDEEDFWCDSHTLSNHQNFCKDESGKLAIFDYGNDRIHHFLEKYGETIHDKFVF